MKKYVLLFLIAIFLVGCEPIKNRTSDTSIEASLTSQSTSDADIVYEKNIMYEDLTKNVENLKGKYISFNGNIESINEGTGYSQLKVTFDGNKNNFIYVKVSDEKLSHNNLEVGNQLVIKGKIEGEFTFDEETIPALIADSVEIIN